MTALVPRTSRTILVGPMIAVQALKRLALRDDDVIIGIDGGVSKLSRAGMPCRLAIGDWDSIRGEPVGDFVITLPRQKDFTDFAFALWAADILSVGRELVLVGLDGGRVDHEMGVFLEISEFMKTARTKTVRWLREDGEFIFMKGMSQMAIKRPPGRLFSLFSLSPASTGIETSGARYQPRSGRLSQPSHGISNAVRGPASVRLHKGVLLVIIPLA